MIYRYCDGEGLVLEKDSGRVGRGGCPPANVSSGRMHWQHQ